MNDIYPLLIVSVGTITFATALWLFDKWISGDFSNYTKLYKEIRVLEYLNSDIKEIDIIVKRLKDEVNLDLIKRKWQLRERFSQLMISYGYVSKLDLKIAKQIKEK